MEMAVGPTNMNSGDNAVASQGYDAPDLQVFVFALFFVFGGLTSLNDVIIPKLKELFTLNYAQVMLVNTAFFLAYALISMPGAAIVERFGYLRTAAIGLVVMTAGCLLFIPASHSAAFPLFLGALFVLGAGITIVQVVANPLISLLGKPATAHSRLTFAQAFNSLGTTIFPYVGSMLILGSLSKVDPKTLTGGALDAYRASETQVIVHTYLGLAVALLIVAAVVWTRRNRIQDTQPERANILRAFGLLAYPRFAFGALCIFLYVGAEVSIGSLIVNYMHQPANAVFLTEASSNPIPFYWGGAMVGRFIGAYALQKIAPGKVLAFNAAVAILLLVISANTTGLLSGWSYLAIGLFNSIMFPTIFALACEGLGKRSAEGSGIMATAIVGGAVVPWLTGALADQSSLRFALVLPAICYAVICAFGMFARKPNDTVVEGA
jgi:MFS transporter, FHS family, L-fucose permease